MNEFGLPPKTIFGLEQEFGTSWPALSRIDYALISERMDSQYASELFMFYLHSFLVRSSPFRTNAVSISGPPGNQLGWTWTNGSRIYLDVGHPEYCTPECEDPRSAILWSKAGEYLLEIILRDLNRRIARLDIPTIKEIVFQRRNFMLFGKRAKKRKVAGLNIGPIGIYKNNTDIKNLSYGTHENYLCLRDKILHPDTPEFSSIERYDKMRHNLIPFLITRQIFSGAGGFWRDYSAADWRYVLSPRAMDTQFLVGGGTTNQKPCISTRDEPLSQDNYFRVHLPCADALMSEFAAYLALGTTRIILFMIEDGWLNGQIVFDCETIGQKFDSNLRQEAEREILGYFKKISVNYIDHPDFRMSLRRRTQLTAWEIQNEYLKLAQEYFQTIRNPCWWEKDIMAKWEMTLELLKNNSSQKPRFIEWASKLRTLKGVLKKRGNIPDYIVENKGITDREIWDKKIRRQNGQKEEKIGDILISAAIQYTDIRKEKGLYWVLARNGAVERLFSEYEIKQAIRFPPLTRAFLREYARILAPKYSCRLDILNWNKFSAVDERTNQSFQFTADIPFGGKELENEMERLENWFRAVVSSSLIN